MIAIVLTANALSLMEMEMLHAEICCSEAELSGWCAYHKAQRTATAEALQSP